MTENYDIISIISSKGEIVPLNSAISPAEAKVRFSSTLTDDPTNFSWFSINQGIVERWLDQLEDSMIQSLCDINNKAVRTYSSTPMNEWIFQWPAMIAFNALCINWTADTENALTEDTLQVWIMNLYYEINTFTTWNNINNDYFLLTTRLSEENIIIEKKNIYKQLQKQGTRKTNKV